MRSIIKLLRAAYKHMCTALNWLQSPLLLAIRPYWGWQFAQDGWGTVSYTHLDVYKRQRLPCNWQAADSKNQPDSRQ